MKTKTMALALVLLATASGAAIAQEHQREGGRDREPRGHVGPSDQGQRAVARGVYQRRAEPGPTQATEARRAPEARPAPAGPEAGGGGRRSRGGQNWTQSGRWVDRDGDADTSGLTGADRLDHEDRVETRDFNIWNGRDGRQGDGPQAGDRRGGSRDPQAGGERPRGQDGRDRARTENDRNRGDSRWDGDRGDRNRGERDRGDNRNGGDRRWVDRDGRGPPANVARWDRRNYPSVYTSRHRYRGHVWRAPVGFYVHSWAFGEILPRGWYDEPYRLMDWWIYGLPMPPPGYDWVHVGYDAVLIDSWNGRVVQVVRMLFW